MSLYLKEERNASKHLKELRGNDADAADIEEAVSLDLLDTNGKQLLSTPNLH